MSKRSEWIKESGVRASDEVIQNTVKVSRKHSKTSSENSSASADAGKDQQERSLPENTNNVNKKLASIRKEGLSKSQSKEHVNEKKGNSTVLGSEKGNQGNSSVMGNKGNAHGTGNKGGSFGVGNKGGSGMGSKGGSHGAGGKGAHGIGGKGAHGIGGKGAHGHGR